MPHIKRKLFYRNFKGFRPLGLACTFVKVNLWRDRIDEVIEIYRVSKR